MTESAGPNIISVLGRDFLIAHTTTGDAAHLVPREEQSDLALAAIPPDTIGSVVGYDRVALAQPLWAINTICGRTWHAMSGGEAGPWNNMNPVHLTPTCRSCLRVLDSLFPPPDVNASIELVASLACDLVEQFGVAEVWLVPGDQLERLRRAIRAAVRTRLGFSCKTLRGGDALYVHCDKAYALHQDEHEERAAAALSNAFDLDDDAPRRTFSPPEWRIDWRTWST